MADPEPKREEVWRSQETHPEDYRIVELETCGDIVRGSHTNGRWVLENSHRSVHVTRWRVIA